MKKLIINFSFLILAISSCLPAKAANDAYIQAMQKALASYDEVESLEDYQNVANTFERIARMESEEWLPPYYTGLTYVYMSFEEGLDNDQRDDYLAIAQKHADRAGDLSEENIEIVILHGYIKMAKLSVNPALRGMVLSPQAHSLFEKARKMDPKNPRAAIMLARMKYGTAQFFNSSTDESCQLARESINLFGKEKDRGIEPHWGKGLAEGLVKACGKD